MELSAADEIIVTTHMEIFRSFFASIFFFLFLCLQNLVLPFRYSSVYDVHLIYEVHIFCCVDFCKYD